MRSDNYRPCMSYFYACAVTAWDPVEAGIDLGERPLNETDEQDLFLRVRDVMSPDASWKHILMLSRAAQRFNNTLSAKPLINPVPWAICSDLYMTMASKNPGVYHDYDPDLKFLTDIIDQGGTLRLALENITYEPLPVANNARMPNEMKPSAERKGNKKFFQALLASYRGRVKAFENLISAKRREFEASSSSVLGYNILLDGMQPALRPIPLKEVADNTGVPLTKKIILPCPTPDTPYKNKVIDKHYDFAAGPIDSPGDDQLLGFVPNLFRVAQDLHIGNGNGLEFCFREFHRIGFREMAILRRLYPSFWCNPSHLWHLRSASGVFSPCFTLICQKLTGHHLRIFGQISLIGGRK